VRSASTTAVKPSLLIWKAMLSINANDFGIFYELELISDMVPTISSMTLPPRSAMPKASAAIESTASCHLSSIKTASDADQLL
jgi:hypothetical protein